METTAEKAAVSLGKANFTCPYCDRALRFDARTNRIVQSQDGELLRYHHGAAARRAAYENTSIFGLMRDKGMLKGDKHAFQNYLFKDRQTPLTDAEGETVHAEKEINT